MNDDEKLLTKIFFKLWNTNAFLLSRMQEFIRAYELLNSKTIGRSIQVP